MEPSSNTAETTQLLSELDFAIEQLNTMRDIVMRYDRLHKVESVTGPSRHTRVMRKEIAILENRFNCARSAHELVTDQTAATR